MTIAKLVREFVSHIDPAARTPRPAINGGLMTRVGAIKPLALVACLVGTAAYTSGAMAISFDLEYGDGITGTLNTVMTAGAAMRMQERSTSLVGKANLDPAVCGRTPAGEPLFQSCQGLFKDQTHPAQKLVSSPGQFSLNADNGNLNYDRGDLTQVVLKVTQDVQLQYGEYGLFAKWLYFNDFVNSNFTEFHPNRITRDNYLDVGYIDTTRSDSHPCGSRTPIGAAQCGIVYGPGAVVQSPRTDGEVLRQLGSDLQLFDYYIYGSVGIPFSDAKQLSFKVGNQTLNWGESTVLVINSLNQANALNVNNLFRVGFELSELFVPTGMVVLSAEPFENAAVETFYGYEWKPVEIPAPGGFYSFVDVGSNNAIDDFVIGFGGTAEDPDGAGRLIDNTLSALTNTSSRGARLPDAEPSHTGQYGVTFKYFAEEFNNGTEFGLYFMNYHSKLPYVSFFSVPQSCSKLATSTATFAAACNDVPVLHGGNDPEGATDSIVNFDDLMIRLEYPESIKLFGASFSTTVGDWSMQGEVAYRPDMPLQVALVDLGFAAYGPSLTNCHLAPGCEGSVAGAGVAPGGGMTSYPSSNYVVDAAGSPGAFADTFDLGAGHMPGSGRSFPNFVMPYRGEVLGLNRATDASLPLDERNPGYIRGWENFDVYQFNLGGTYLQGATEGLSMALGADQIILLTEVGAQYVPGLPALDQLQIESPGVFLHASAGADGSGADRSRQACSTNEACSFGPDGLRFNPQQADLGDYADRFSWGYAAILLVRYESVLPGISLQPTVVFMHDVHGTSTDVAAQFTEGRKDFQFMVETRYLSSLSVNVGYNWFTGGGDNNLAKDRDQALAYLKYQF